MLDKDVNVTLQVIDLLFEGYIGGKV